MLKKISYSKRYLIKFNIVLISLLFLITSLFFASELIQNPKSIEVGLGATPGDCDGDGFVDLFDYGYLSRSFGLTQGQQGFDGRCDFHVDQFNIIDLFDYQILANNFGRGGATVTPTPRTSQGPTPTIPPPPPPGNGIWISQANLMDLPTSGTAWQSVLTTASGSWGNPDVSNQDSDHDQMVMAGALVCARTGQHCDKAKQGLLSAIGTEEGARWLAIGRNLTGYAVAADLMRISGHLSGTDLSRVSSWLASFLTRTLANNNSGQQETLTPFGSGSNASAQEGSVYAAIAAYTNNSNKLNYVWNRFRLYSCDRSNNPEQEINVRTGFDGGWSHTTDYSQACAINPAGTTKNNHRIDGAIINDMVRSGSFTWPPGTSNAQYPWVGLEGYIPAALILHRAGFPAFQVQNQAVKRATDYMCFLKNNTPYDWWNAGSSGRASESKHIVKVVYGYNPSGCTPQYPTGSGRVVGFTDWTHATSI